MSFKAQKVCGRLRRPIAQRPGDHEFARVDRSVRESKGPTRPIFPAGERAEILAALEAVDYVTVFDEPTPRNLIARLLPQVLVKGGDWGTDQIVGREEVETAGGRVISLEHTANYSTSRILDKIVENFP